MATKRKKQEYNPEPRVLFNWGFHDGAHEFQRFGGESPIRAEGWRKRFPVYAAGYVYGQALARQGEYDLERGTLSTVAWNKYQAEKQRTANGGAVSVTPTPGTHEVDAVEEANAIIDGMEEGHQLK